MIQEKIRKQEKADKIKQEEALLYKPKINEQHDKLVPDSKQGKVEDRLLQKKREYDERRKNNLVKYDKSFEQEANVSANTSNINKSRRDKSKNLEDNSGSQKTTLEKAYEHYIDQQTNERMKEQRQDMAIKMTKGYKHYERQDNYDFKPSEIPQNELVVRENYQPDLVPSQNIKVLPSPFELNQNEIDNQNLDSRENFKDYLKESSEKRYSTDPGINNGSDENESKSNNPNDEMQSGSDKNEIRDDSPKPEPQALEIDQHYDENRESSDQPDHEDYDGEGEDDNFPILFLDVNLGKDRVERLVIYDGDDPFQVAEDFCNKNGLEEKKKRKLAKVIKKQLDSLLTRIEEDEDEEDSRS